MTSPKSPKILITAQSIREYMGGISEKVFKDYISMKLPVWLHNGRYLAHADNIDLWFQQNTKIQRIEGEETEDEG